MYSRHWHCRGLIFVPVLASIATIIWFTFIAAANERQITPSSIVNGTTHSLVTSVAPSIQYCLGDFINSRDAVGAESCFRVLDDWMVQYFDRRQQKLLILNKVPKCGSTEMYHLLKGLSRKHNFQYKSLQKEYWGSSEHHLGLWVEEVGNMVKMAYLQEDKAAVLDGHAAWIDFAAQGRDVPLYVNVVRDPISRLRSHYYYLVSDMRGEKAERARKTITSFFSDNVPFNLETHTLTACLKIPSCLEHAIPNFIQPPIRAFMPMGRAYPASYPINLEDSTLALKILQEEFLVVITLEDMDKGIGLLECLLPQVYKNAQALFLLRQSHGDKARANDSKPPIDVEDYDLLRKVTELSGEAELYQAAVVKMCNLWTWAEHQTHCPALPKKAPAACAY